MKSLTRHLTLGSFLCSYLHLITENSILISLKQFRVLVNKLTEESDKGFRTGSIRDLVVRDYSRLCVLRGCTLPPGLVLLPGLRRGMWSLAGPAFCLLTPSSEFKSELPYSAKPRAFQWLEDVLDSFCGQRDSTPYRSSLWLSSLITMRRNGSLNWWWVGPILGTRDEREGKLITVANMYWAIQTS